jgi:lipopolysaccharide transport system ATP-binding protein
MMEFMEQGGVLVFASHRFDLLEKFCERTIWLDEGRVVADGPTREVTGMYRGKVSQ